MCQFSNKFLSAVRALASDGPIKTRLVAAYTQNLALLPEDDMPDSIRPRFDQLRQSLQAVKPLSTESTIVASVRKMSTEDANRCAASIVIMFSELVRVKTTGERLKVDKSNGNGRHTAALN